MFKRILTAILLIAFVVAVLVWTPIWLFKLLVLLLIAGSLHEYYRLVLTNDWFSLLTGMLFGLVLAVMLIFDGLVGEYVFPITLASIFIIVLAHMMYSTVAEGVVSKLGLIFFGTVYLSLTLPAFVWLRTSSHGRTLIVLTIGIVAWVTLFQCLAVSFLASISSLRLSVQKRLGRGWLLHLLVE